MSAVQALDLLCVLVVVLGACAWLVLRFRSPAAPACHQTVPVDGRPDELPPSQVVLGSSLQRGLERARQRAR